MKMHKDWNDCTPACEATQECPVCHRRKAPVGRDVAAAMGGGLCDSDCPGYRRDPKPGHLWPGELAQLEGEAMPDMSTEPEEP